MLRSLAALRGGRAEGGPAGHCLTDHPGCQVSESLFSCTASVLLCLVNFLKCTSLLDCHRVDDVLRTETLLIHLYFYFMMKKH